MHKLRYISLFSGGFGLDLGLEEAQTEQVSFCPAACIDIAVAARQTIRRNRPDLTVIGDRSDEHGGDLTQISTQLLLERAGLQPKEPDLIVAGTPCQSWSILGKRKGYDDPRGNLMLEFVRVIREAQPRAFILENVEGFLTCAKGEAYQSLLRRLQRAGLGYKVVTWRLNAVNFGVPQYRARIFIIGFRKDLSIDATKVPPPKPTHRPPHVAGTLPLEIDSDLLKYQTVRQAFAKLAKNAPNNEVRVHGDRVRNRYALLKPGERDPVDHTDRLCWDEPSGTVLVGSSAGGGRPFIHPQHHRHLTVREAARLQSFPDTWIFEGGPTAQYRQVGNAVPPPLAAAVGRAVARSLIPQASLMVNPIPAAEPTSALAAGSNPSNAATQCKNMVSTCS